MSKEIKFRAWDKKTNKMYFVASIDMFGKVVTLLDDIGDTLDFIVRAMDDVELMQFTGLLDKNDVDIHEGDIIKYVTQYYGNRLERKKVVEWIDDMQDDSFGEPLSMGYRFYGGDIEVIGNIYENSNLLERK